MQKKIIIIIILILFFVIPLHIPFHIHYDTDKYGCVFCQWEKIFSSLVFFIFSLYFFFTLFKIIIYSHNYFYVSLPHNFYSIRAPPKDILN